MTPATGVRVVLDQLLAPVPGGIGRYAANLTTAMIAAAPAAAVSGVVSAESPERVDALIASLPGLAAVEQTSLRRRELSLAWQLGLAPLGGADPVHAMSVLAPLGRSGRGFTTVSTIHDAVPWTHPQTLTPRGVSFHRAMARRAARFADAIVVPTAAVADAIGGVLGAGDRIHVIGAAVSPDLVLPLDGDARAAALGLPDRFVLAVGTLEPRKGLEPLIRSLAEPGATDLPLLIVGSPGWGGVDIDSIARAAGLAEGRVRALGRISDSDLALVITRAAAFVQPSLAEGFGIPLLEAMHFGTPVVHSDDPALVEVSGGAGRAVAREDSAGYPARLAEAVAAVLADPSMAERMSADGRVASARYSWEASARAALALHFS